MQSDSLSSKCKITGILATLALLTGERDIVKSTYPISNHKVHDLPISHCCPSNPCWQKQVYWFIPSTQVPPLKHGPDWHSSISETIFIKI